MLSAFLRLLLGDAQDRELIAENPLDRPLRKRTTKAARAQRIKRVTFRPFIAAELERLLDVLHAPRDEREGIFFPPTEAMLLTGLRWGEVCGLLWSDVSWTGGQVNISRALPRRGENKTEPTKTAARWSISLRPPLADLLMRQQARSACRSSGRTNLPGLPRPTDRVHDLAEAGLVCRNPTGSCCAPRRRCAEGVPSDLHHVRACLRPKPQADLRGSGPYLDTHDERCLRQLHRPCELARRHGTGTGFRAVRVGSRRGRAGLPMGSPRLPRSSKEKPRRANCSSGRMNLARPARLERATFRSAT